MVDQGEDTIYISTPFTFGRGWPTGPTVHRGCCNRCADKSCTETLSTGMAHH